MIQSNCVVECAENTGHQRDKEYKYNACFQYAFFVGVVILIAVLAFGFRLDTAFFRFYQYESQYYNKSGENAGFRNIRANKIIVGNLQYRSEHI